MDRKNKRDTLEAKITEATAALSQQVDDYKNKGQNILLVGGIILAAYVLYSLLTSGEEEAEEVRVVKSPSVFGKALMGILSSFAINVANEKVREYMSNSSEDNDDTE